jgi:threonine/homoserine/homoserine lactone efflux protein
MIAMLAQGVSIGFAAGMTPGPLLVFLLAQTLQHGWRRAIWIILSPLISDGPIVALVLLVLQGASDDLLRLISLLGGAFILYIAWGLWRQIRAGDWALPLETEPASAAESVGAVLRKAAAINALGPGPWLFWSTAMGPTVIAAWRDGPPGAIGFVAAFYGAFLGVMAAQVIVFHQARRLGPQVVRAALWIGLAALLFFAASLWRNALLPAW